MEDERLRRPDPLGGRPDPLRGRPEPMKESSVLLTGELVESVEGGQAVLRAEDGTTYVLSGPGRADLVGLSGPVTVRGHLDPELRSTAMQGSVFVVTDIVASPGTPTDGELP